MSAKKLAPLLALLPEESWVYLMKNAGGEIIYVGKSKNLKSRVNSYFARIEDLTVAKRSMVGQIDDIQIITTQTEIEALVLETNLIKKHRPKYNILMKDDKNLSYIVVSDGPVQEVFRTRVKPTKGTFFGPFTSGASIHITLRALKKIFKIRACRMKFGTAEGRTIITAKAGKTPPCMDYYIGLCPAPCLLTDSSISEHAGSVESLKKFLRGQMSEVVNNLKAQMAERAQKLEFEEAGKIKSQLEAISVLAERQIARDAVAGSYDAITLLSKYEKFWIGLTIVREGEIQGVFHYELERTLDETPEELITYFMVDRYSEPADRISKILLESAPLDMTVTSYFKSIGVTLEIPELGSKSEILAFTKRNILGYAHRLEMAKLASKTLTKATMASVLTELGYTPPTTGPITFECYDNSHTHGKFTVASRSVTVNGKPEKALYRKYQLRTLEQDKIDDFESMREIMERRTLEGLERGNFPTLILLDGGKWQLSSGLEGVERGIAKWKVQRVLNEAWALDASPAEATVSLPYFASIAKREEEIFTPGQSTPTLFIHGSPELMLLQQIRDEAHRFAIGFNRGLRSKAMKKNLLEELPGFWPVTRRELMKLAGSIDGILALSLEELQSVCSAPQIETLRDHGLIGG